ncbi:hypothetical protein GOODEAATRI_000230 [Goodea atripinnis]|uniref:Uncharacterized protein n=1 Tax=Goodea atripinnis TaxID=208336 RepID=A0ABV0N6M8_9TELE
MGQRSSAASRTSVTAAELGSGEPRGEAAFPGLMNYQLHLANSAAIRSEIQRFESVHPNIYSIYELLERVEEPLLQNQIREHVIAIEEVTPGAVQCQLNNMMVQAAISIQVL